MQSLYNNRVKEVVLQFARFVAMGGVSSIITVGAPIFLHEVFSIEEEVSVAAALVIAFFVNFLTNRIFVFRSTGRSTSQLTRFAVTSGLFRAGEYVFFLLCHTLLGLHYVLALFVTLACSLAVKFVVYRRYVFTDGTAAA